MPLIGGTSRAFLGEFEAAPSWSPDGTRIVYFNTKPGGGDPMFVADRTGADARQILAVAPDEVELHNHNPIWSPDGRWIYFVRGRPNAADMDVWRIRPIGGPPERLTEQHRAMNFLTPLDARTLLYVARAEDRSGPWLWTLDVDRKVTRRVNSGLDHYTSVAASRDGRRIVATTANPTASLWTVPILDRLAEDHDVSRHPVTTAPALAPRFGGKSLYYLSPRGTGALWRFHDGQASEVWKGAANQELSDPPAVSPDGLRVAVVVRQEGRGRLTVRRSRSKGRQGRALSTGHRMAPGL
jgi:Tol biopolymer transport system component